MLPVIAAKKGDYSFGTPYLSNHIVDQRNIQLTERIKGLPSILPKEDFNKGNYVLVNFGLAHTEGMNYYLKHPIIKKVKKLLYSFNYDLVDSDNINKYVPSNGVWSKKVLEK